MIFVLIPPILIFPEHQQEENKEKEYQKLMKVIVEESADIYRYY
jgi:hypothetical protein